jgi:hypothetical protein
MASSPMADAATISRACRQLLDARVTVVAPEPPHNRTNDSFKAADFGTRDAPNL